MTCVSPASVNVRTRAATTSGVPIVMRCVSVSTVGSLTYWLVSET